MRKGGFDVRELSIIRKRRKKSQESLNKKRIKEKRLQKTKTIVITGNL